MPNIKVGSVMSKDVLTADKDENVMHLIERLQKHRIGAVVIVNKDDMPIGIITERDVMRALVAYKEKLFAKQAQDIMSAPVLTIEPDEDIDSASILMSLNNIRRIPVTKNNKLAGLVSYRDLANALRKSNYMLEEKAEELEDLANHDPLTGLFNKRFIMKELDKQFGIAAKAGTSMAVIMLDIDHFKKVNDTYGHPCGDHVLKTLASILMGKSRDINMVGRYGGEEFIIIGPISDEKSSLFFAERLREAVEQTTMFCEANEIRVTISIGVCVWNQKIKDAKAMIKHADDALYAAKREGRNRVKMAEF